MNLNINHQIILYAKGHYIRGHSSYVDIVRICRYTDHENSFEFIVKALSHLALTAIKEATIDKLQTPPGKSEQRQNAITKINNSITPLTEYTEQMMFLYKNMPEISKYYRPDPMDSDEDFQVKLEQIYKESLLQSLLMIIARWNVTEELEEANENIMPLSSPKKKKERYSE